MRRFQCLLKILKRLLIDLLTEVIVSDSYSVLRILRIVLRVLLTRLIEGCTDKDG